MLLKKIFKFYQSLYLTVLVSLVILFGLAACLPERQDDTKETTEYANSAFTSICDTKALCHFAVEAANLFANHPVLTCYQSKSHSQKTNESAPDIDLGTNPHAHTNEAGWLDFALRHSSTRLKEVYDEIASLKSPKDPWTPAYQYHNHFHQLATNQRTSTVLMGDEDLANLQSGDILSWCHKSWCEGKSAQGTSGYVGIVMGVTPIKRDHVVAHLGTVPQSAKFWQVAVVDSSPKLHGSQYSDTLTVVDHRRHTGTPQNTNCSQNGGLGAGAIILAQWENANQEKQWGYLFYNEANHFFSDNKSHEHIRIAFGRPL